MESILVNCEECLRVVVEFYPEKDDYPICEDCLSELQELSDYD